MWGNIEWYEYCPDGHWFVTSCIQVTSFFGCKSTFTHKSLCLGYLLWTLPCQSHETITPPPKNKWFEIAFFSLLSRFFFSRFFFRFFSRLHFLQFFHFYHSFLVFLWRWRGHLRWVTGDDYQQPLWMVDGKYNTLIPKP